MGRGHTTAIATALCLLALLCAAAPSAHAGTPLQKGFWGPTQIDGVSQFPVYDDLGVTLFQMSVSWAQAAPTRPADARDPRDPAYVWPPDVDFAIREAQAPRHEGAAHAHPDAVLGQRRPDAGVRTRSLARLRRLRARGGAALPGRAPLDDLGRAVALEQLQAVRRAALRRADDRGAAARAAALRAAARRRLRPAQGRSGARTSSSAATRTSPARSGPATGCER